MTGKASALAPLVRPLPPMRTTGNRSAMVLDTGLTLVIDDHCSIGGKARGSASRSRAGSYCATLSGSAGRIGLDIETLDRVSLNASADDDWLAPDERTLVDVADAPNLELACHWVLKEAFGKALGVGLALPLAAMSFAGIGDAIVLRGVDAPIASGSWSFALYRFDSLVIGIARSLPQAMTPLAPAGRNPPAAPLER